MLEGLKTWVGDHLGELESIFSGSFDNVLLFSGKDFTSGTAGLAYVGSMCGAVPASSVNMIRPVSAMRNAIVASHEMGHNLGLYHQYPPPPDTRACARLPFAKMCFYDLRGRSAFGSQGPQERRLTHGHASPPPPVRLQAHRQRGDDVSKHGLWVGRALGCGVDHADEPAGNPAHAVVHRRPRCGFLDLGLILTVRPPLAALHRPRRLAYSSLVSIIGYVIQIDSCKPMVWPDVNYRPGTARTAGGLSAVTGWWKVQRL